MSNAIHDIKIDPRNLDILISINGELVSRALAVVSVFDSGFIMGDGVWEGLRLVKGGIPFLHRHFEPLLFEEHRAKVPYIPFLRTPYYVFVGRKRTPA